MLILTTGRFGDAVAKRIKAQRSASHFSLLQTENELRSLFSDHDSVLVCNWRPYTAETLLVNRLCHQLAIPLAIVELNGQTLNLCPDIRPSSGNGCYACYQSRSEAHQYDGERAKVIRHAYAKDKLLGVEGFTAAMVEMASGWLLQCYEHRVPAREFRCVSVVTSTVMESVLLPLPYCEFCRPELAEQNPQDRFTNVLVPEFARIMKQ